MVSQIISEDIDQKFPKNWDHCWGVGVVGHLSCNNILSGDSFGILQFCTGFAISVQRKFNISGKLSETIAFAGVDYFFGTDTTGKRLKFLSNKVSLKAKSFKSWKNTPKLLNFTNFVVSYNFYPNLPIFLLLLLLKHSIHVYSPV